MLWAPRSPRQLQPLKCRDGQLRRVSLFTFLPSNTLLCKRTTVTRLVTALKECFPRYRLASTRKSSIQLICHTSRYMSLTGVILRLRLESNLLIKVTVAYTCGTTRAQVIAMLAAESIRTGAPLNITKVERQIGLCVT